MPVALELLHEGVDEGRRLRLVPLSDRASMLIEIRHHAAGGIGGPAPDRSPAAEVLVGELVPRLDAILAAARAGHVAFDTVDDIDRPGRCYLRLRADPADQTIVARIVDLDQRGSNRGDWPDAPGAVRICDWDWVEVAAYLRVGVERCASAAVIPFPSSAGPAAERRADSAR